MKLLRRVHDVRIWIRLLVGIWLMLVLAWTSMIVYATRRGSSATWRWIRPSSSPTR